MNIIHSQDDAQQADTTMTPEETQLLRDFRRLNDNAQDYALGFMKHYSANPNVQRAQKKASLRVVKGGAT